MKRTRQSCNSRRGSGGGAPDAEAIFTAFFQKRIIKHFLV